MEGFKRHLLVCTNRRDPQNPKGSCAHKGSEAICEFLKKELNLRGMKGVMRANSSGCLDQCAAGPSVVIYPEAVWYTVPTVEDAREILEEHMLQGRVVERLRMK